MSFGPGGYPTLDITAPDNDVEVSCRGCQKMTVQVTAQRVYITFGIGEPPQYGQAEVFLPVTGSVLRRFDAFKVRAYTKAAALPAGAQQAHVTLTPLVR